MHLAHRPTPRARTLLALPVTLLLAGLYACGGGGASNAYSTGPGSTGGTTGSANTTSIVIKNIAYHPQFDTVAVGSTVSWANTDAITHTVTSDSGVFNSGNITAGQTYKRTFSTAGVFPYHCLYHGSPGAGMYGILVVK